MAGKTIETQYWDTCIFYALFKEEQHRDGELEALKNSWREFESGRLRIITSALTLAEVVREKMGEQNYAKLVGLKFAPGFKYVQVAPNVIEVAADIRDHYLKHPLPNSEGMTVGMGDAIHLASAIIRDADVLVTTDGRNKNQKKELGMLKLPPQITPGHYIHIRRPIPPPQIEFEGLEEPPDEWV